jgi:hypothetical protein
VALAGFFACHVKLADVMIDKFSSFDLRFRLNQTTVVRPRGRFVFATFWEALDSFRLRVKLGDVQNFIESAFYNPKQK